MAEAAIRKIFTAPIIASAIVTKSGVFYTQVNRR
jgi:hypothetical protein